jgi:rhodanese-related sulfurtransferase
MDRHESPVQIIDSRSEGEFQEAHIRGAINLTLAVQETTPLSLPFKKAEKLVFYCNGFS